MRRSLSLLFLALWSCVAWADPCSQPPAEWRDYLRYDQTFNVPGRPPLNASETSTQLVYEFAVSTQEGAHATSRSDPNITSPTSTLYVAQSWTKSSLGKLVKTLGHAPLRTLCGQRVQGHSTVFVWDPEGKTPPFFTKNDESAGVMKAARLFETALKRSDAPKIGFLPETSFVEIEKGKKGWLSDDRVTLDSVRRETEIVPRSSNSSARLLPLHGFLGSELVESAANKMGLTREEWVKQHYLPGLAEYFDKMHFDVGFMHTSHTQNLLVEYNPDTGKIERFIVRDLHDLYPDYFKLVTEKKLTVPDEHWGRMVNGWGADVKIKN